MIGSAWSGILNPKNGVAMSSSLKWIPYSDFLYGQAFRTDQPQRLELWLNIYCYRDTPTDSIRCLALTKDHGAFEGTVDETLDGQHHLIMDHHDVDNKQKVHVKLTRQSDGSIHQELWFSEQDHTKSVMELIHHPSKK